MPISCSRNLLPHEKAHVTGKWAEIIFRALSARVADRWRFISFRGNHQGEWRGVVDLLAVRKDTSKPRHSHLKRGDLFDFVLVQIKGGTAPSPSLVDRRRLRLVSKRYGDCKVVLFHWRKGVSSKFSTLGRNLEWEPSTKAAIFGR